MTDVPATNPRTHDVFFVTPATKRFYLTNPNRGVTATSQALAWTIDGATQTARLRDIAAIHLQTAPIGNAGVLDQCKIEFSDGGKLTVTNAKANGLPDDAQTPLYRSFIADLHDRLAALPDARIRFSAGVSRLRYRFMVGTLIVAALFFIVTPVGLALFTGDMSALGYAVGGGFLCFPLFKMLKTNAPRDYTADRLPDELLS